MRAGTRTMQGDAARQRILSFIRVFEKEHSYMPNLVEIADGTAMFRNSVRFHLEILRRAEKVAYTDGMMARTLRLL